MSTTQSSLPEVKPGTWWRHRNGNMYLVLFFMNEGNMYQYPEQIAYQGENGKFWCRLASDWHRSMTLVPNYAPVGILDPEVSDLMDNPVFLEIYTLIRNGIGALRSQVPLANTGMTINFPGATLKIY